MFDPPAHGGLLDVVVKGGAVVVALGRGVGEAGVQEVRALGDGQVDFQGIPVGTYLLTQTQASDGYETMNDVWAVVM